MSANRALNAAVALSRLPGLAPMLRSRELPIDIKLILEILAGNREAVSGASDLTGLSASQIAAVAEFYVLNVMLYRDASPRRILGVRLDADRSEVRRHMRDLLTWLHPDKNTNSWQSAFAGRVIAAWRAIDSGSEEKFAVGRPAPRLGRRVQWIAMPLAAAPRPARPYFRPLLVGLALFGGLCLPDEVPYEIGQFLFAITAFLTPPSAASVSSGH